MSPRDLLVPVLQDGDEELLERSLRPRRLDDFVGQERIKEQLGIALDAAKARQEALDHVLLVGPPGLGKTTLAQIVREELGVGIRTVAGPALEKKDVAAVLTALLFCAWLALEKPAEEPAIPTKPAVSSAGADKNKTAKT